MLETVSASQVLLYTTPTVVVYTTPQEILYTTPKVLLSTTPPTFHYPTGSNAIRINMLYKMTGQYASLGKTT